MMPSHVPLAVFLHYNLCMRIICEGPYDLQLSWRMLSAFSGLNASRSGSFAMWWEERPTAVLLKQTSSDPPVVELIAEPLPRKTKGFQQRLRTVLNADLALEPFYRRLRRDRVLRPIVNSLIGLKPFRPPDIFQMLVIAVSEQQISMQAAHSIRERLLSALGTPAGKLTAFPRPQDIASLKADALRECGLSKRKAEYLIELAARVAVGEISIDSWQDMPDDDLIKLLRGYRGVGEWTAEYILVRGLGRMDVVPASDLGVRRVVGHYLADSEDLSPQDVRDLLEPWTPWRGLTAFYMLAHYRMIQMGLDQAQ
jgi:DNA-3-methyladenine glycosylase II